MAGGEEDHGVANVPGMNARLEKISLAVEFGKLFDGNVAALSPARCNSFPEAGGNFGIAEYGVGIDHIGRF